jgi:hypothetical protein
MPVELAACPLVKLKARRSDMAITIQACEGVQAGGPRPAFAIRSAPVPYRVSSDTSRTVTRLIAGFSVVYLATVGSLLYARARENVPPADAAIIDNQIGHDRWQSKTWIDWRSVAHYVTTKNGKVVEVGTRLYFQ